jgi:hypothetical protein
MLQCSHCHIAILAGQVEKDAGDWIIACPRCGVKNILAPILVNKVQLPILEITGWRD